jgi:hypothetical protein
VLDRLAVGVGVGCVGHLHGQGLDGDICLPQSDGVCECVMASQPPVRELTEAAFRRKLPSELPVMAPTSTGVTTSRTRSQARVADGVLQEFEVGGVVEGDFDPARTRMRVPAATRRCVDPFPTRWRRHRGRDPTCPGLRRSARRNQPRPACGPGRPPWTRSSST